MLNVPYFIDLMFISKYKVAKLVGLWDQLLHYLKYGFLLQSAMIDSGAYTIHSILKEEPRIIRYVAKNHRWVPTRYYTAIKLSQWIFILFVLSCHNTTGYLHNCCSLGRFYHIVHISSGWMEQLRIRGEIRKVLTTIRFWYFK